MASPDQSPKNYSRREVLKMFGIGSATIIVNRLIGGAVLRAEAQGRIEAISYETSQANHRSYPWLPLREEQEGLEATGLPVGGPGDKLDTLDIRLKGSYSKAGIRQELTRDFLSRVNDSIPGQASWTGRCRDAAAASYFAPRIVGPIDLEGIHFTERDRLVIAVWTYGGLAMDPFYPEINDYAIGQIGAHLTNREPLVVNWSENPEQEWWGIATGIAEDGRVVITRHIRWDELGEKESNLDRQLKVEHKNIRSAGILRLDRPQPGFEGNYDLVNKDVAGLVIGTHRLV